MYTPTLLHTYKASKSHLPIGAWISAVAKNLPQFQDNASIYNAVPVNIKIAGSPAVSNGNVSVSVAAFEPNWYQSLVDSLAKMTKQPAEKIAVVSYLGEPIKDLSSGQLACIGECDIIDVTTKKPIRLAQIVAPPLKLATNKTAQLTEWWNGSRDEISRQIAASFKGLSMAELAKQTVDGGATNQLIRNYLVGHTLHNLSWDEFAKTYGKTSPISADQVAGNILAHVREALVQNQTQVRNFHAISGEATLWKRGTGAPAQTKDEFTMYRDIVEDAIFHPMIGQGVIQSVMYGVVKRGQSKPKAERSYNETPPPPLSYVRRRELEEEKDDEFVELGNPVTSYYRDYHQPVHGKVPYHHIEALNKGYGRAETKYPGDPKKVLELFNLYSGRSVIGCDACGAKKKKKKHQQQEEEPIERKLVPISSAAAVAPQRRLIPIDSVGMPLPPLIRLDKAAAAAAPSALPRLIPIGSIVDDAPLPRLIPIGSNIPLPRLIPIDAKMGAPTFADDYEPTLEDFM